MLILAQCQWFVIREINNFVFRNFTTEIDNLSIKGEMCLENMNLVERFIEDKIKKYGIKVLIFFIIVSVFLLNWIEGWFNRQRFRLPFYIHTAGFFYGVILFVGLILSLMFFLWFWEKILSFYLIIFTLFRDKIILIPRISEWIFQGSLNFIGDSLEITASDSGGLIKDYLYKNFLMTFNLKIVNGGRAGIIFRAQDLENYLMLQIVLQDGFKFPDGSVGTRIYDIVPHIRFLGSWETFNITPEPYHSTRLKYICEKGLLINLEVKDYMAILTIKSNNETEEFRWNIPTHTELNIYRQQVASEESSDITKIDPLDGKFVPKIWFRDRHGRIGFRAYAWEKAVVSDLKIKKI